MSTAPSIDIDLTEFWTDPYPTLARLRREAPIALIPQLDATLFCKRDDIFTCEKNVEVFSSHQPDGLMNKLMGQNMMRKDGAAHMAERQAIFPAISPKTVKTIWKAQFETHADTVVQSLKCKGSGDFCKDFALPFSGECLKSITGLTNISFREMDRWSQAMIDGIANYSGNPLLETRCHEATAGIDAAIDDIAPVLAKKPDHSLLGAMIGSGMPMESIRANIKLAISGGQNEPRDAIAGSVWSLLTHPDQLVLVQSQQVSWMQVFEEYARWISPIGMSPRRIATDYRYKGIEFEKNERVFFMFSSANRDESHFAGADHFDVARDTSKSIAFGAGPHFCAGAWASRAMVADVALPTIFRSFKNLRLMNGTQVAFRGWAFRGVLNLPLSWDY